MTSASGGNVLLQLKHHIISGRLQQAKKLVATSQLALEDATDEDSNTPLHWCVLGLESEIVNRESTDEETLVFLMQNGAPKNRQNLLGETPLLAAVRLALRDERRAESLIGEMLRKASVDPRRGDCTGETPLMEAAAAGLEGIAKLLLEHRASPLAESTSGHTALQFAEDSGYHNLVRLLKSPLAEKAAKEACGLNGEELEESSLARQAKNFEQTLFGQKMQPGLVRDQAQPGKPYPEYGTLHDID